MPTLYETYNVAPNTASNLTNVIWGMQSFTPSISHTITKVVLCLARQGSPGVVTASIRNTSGGVPTGADLAVGTMDGNTLPVYGGWPPNATWNEIVFATGVVLVAGVVYAIVLRAATGDVVWVLLSPGGYASGSHVVSLDSGATWTVGGTDDAMFEDWGDGATPSAPTVTTQAVTAISGTTATGNGNITSLGVPNPTQHGHCWNTTGTPTTAGSKTQNGAASATGAFTSAITGLTAGTKYYVRAYATNDVGTSYGNEVIFWADKGTVAPTDVLTRVSSITRTFWAGAPGSVGPYQAQLTTGGVSALYIPPIGSREVVSSAGPTTPPVGPGFQQADYLRWLMNPDLDTDYILKLFGHFPTYQEWVIYAKAFRSGLRP